MRVSAMNWRQVEAWLERDDRAVVPLGSTEQHAQLSLSTDSLLAERVSLDAAEPLGIPVFPVISYGITPMFRAYPGTVCMRVETLLAVMRDVFDSLAASGFRRILVVNGHGGNSPVGSVIHEWIGDQHGVQVKLHNWWNAPRVLAKVQEIDANASHASWMESFTFTRVPGVTPPETPKPMLDLSKLQGRDPAAIREFIGDGSFGGRYQRPDSDMDVLWRVAVEETRDLMQSGWL
ncbi:MAG TPA: creatininase family protein [Candidatus Sulfotelmatobacter sp.]|nr:creatininase family protein [Candidatus Sulfotelmatobacter sp.]